MRVLGKLWGIAIVFLVANLVYAQDGWKSKPYRQWTKQDVLKLGSESPWAQVRHADVTIGEFGTPANYMRAVTIQLRSALHIRQALVRVKQLEAKYDAMNDKQRAEFDAKTQEMLECRVCADKYIVALGPPVSTGSGANAINALRSATLGLLQGCTYPMNAASAASLSISTAPGSWGMKRSSYSRDSMSRAVRC